MSSIRVSEKHGVNPTIPLCFYCGNEKNEVLLLGRLPEDKEAPRNMVFDYEPCDECKSFMEQGIILISVDSALTKDRTNPYRTGGWWVVTEEAVRRIFDKKVVDQICTRRFAFVEDSACSVIGLVKGVQE